MFDSQGWARSIKGFGADLRGLITEYTSFENGGAERILDAIGDLEVGLAKLLPIEEPIAIPIRETIADLTDEVAARSCGLDDRFQRLDMRFLRSTRGITERLPRYGVFDIGNRQCELAAYNWRFTKEYAYRDKHLARAIYGHRSWSASYQTRVATFDHAVPERAHQLINAASGLFEQLQIVSRVRAWTWYAVRPRPSDRSGRTGDLAIVGRRGARYWLVGIVDRSLGNSFMATGLEEL